MLGPANHDVDSSGLAGTAGIHLTVRRSPQQAPGPGPRYEVATSSRAESGSANESEINCCDVVVDQVRKTPPGQHLDGEDLLDRLLKTARRRSSAPSDLATSAIEVVWTPGLVQPDLAPTILTTSRQRAKSTAATERIGHGGATHQTAN